MYQTCPKCGHERGPEETGPADMCGACGLIYAKYLKQRFAAHPGASVEPPSEPRAAWRSWLLEPDGAGGAGAAWARAALLVALVVYGIRLARMDVPDWEMSRSLVHLPMVPIHEFGHILFLPLGEFMHLLGGSLFQVALPLVFGTVFLTRRDPFAAAVMLWWSAVAVMDVAPYVYDAQQPVHVLLTGRTGETGAHDFIDVLGDLGLLEQAQAVGWGVHRVGMLLLAVAILWAAAVLYLQYRNRDAGT